MKMNFDGGGFLGAYDAGKVRMRGLSGCGGVQNTSGVAVSLLLVVLIQVVLLTLG